MPWAELMEKNWKTLGKECLVNVISHLCLLTGIYPANLALSSTETERGALDFLDGYISKGWLCVPWKRHSRILIYVSKGQKIIYNCKSSKVKTCQSEVKGHGIVEPVQSLIKAKGLLRPSWSIIIFYFVHLLFTLNVANLEVSHVAGSQ